MSDADVIDVAFTTTRGMQPRPATKALAVQMILKWEESAEKARRRSTRAAPRGPLHEGRSTGVAPRGPLHGGVADLFYTDVRSILMVLRHLKGHRVRERQRLHRVDWRRRQRPTNAKREKCSVHVCL